MNYTKQQLIDALVAEYDYLCHDDFDPDVDLTIDEYREMLKEMTFDELVKETSTDEEYTFDEFMENWSVI